MHNIDNDEFIESDDDMVEDYTNVDGGIYPYSENVDLSKIEINLREERISVFEIIRWTEKGKFILDPEFQRSPNAWDLNKKSMFIESLILNLPLPHFYFNKDNAGRLVVIDGLQRLTAILDFNNNSFKLEGLKALPWLNGLDKLELEEKRREIWSKIEDKNIPYYAIMPSVPLGVTYDIFRRINTGGTKLERQEIRNCIYIGNSTRLLKKLSGLEIFNEVTDSGIPTKRMKEREAILRCLSFYDSQSRKEYRGDLDDFLGGKMKEINMMSDEEVNSLANIFTENFNKIKELFGCNAFRVSSYGSRGRINIAVMESVYSAIGQLSLEHVVENKSKLLENYSKLMADYEYLDSVRTSTNQTKKLKTRFEKASFYLGLNHAN